MVDYYYYHGVYINHAREQTTFHTWTTAQLNNKVPSMIYHESARAFFIQKLKHFSHSNEYVYYNEILIVLYDPEPSKL